MQGDFVVLAAEPLCICGIDVAAPPKARPSTIQDIHDIKKSFTQQLTSAEVCDAAIATFSENLVAEHRIWSMDLHQYLRVLQCWSVLAKQSADDAVVSSDICWKPSIAGAGFSDVLESKGGQYTTAPYCLCP